jgi:hypothetical protein
MIRQMKRIAFSSFVLLWLPACAIPATVARFGDRCPPPEFGRPGWVRVCAGAGAWIGGIVGGVASIALLPVTYPVSLLAGDGLGEQSKSEFLLFPALCGATIGHAVLGTPPDVLDFAFRRAWVDAPDPVTSFEFVPMPGPGVEPVDPAPPPAAGPAPTETGTEAKTEAKTEPEPKTGAQDR